MKKVAVMIAVAVGFSAVAQADEEHEERRLKLRIDLGIPIQTKPPPKPQPPPAQAPAAEVPQVKLSAAPRFIYSPVLDFYISTSIPYDIVYVGRTYYLFWRGDWYKSSFYNGPYALVTPQMMPQVLAQYNIDQIRFYRNKEYKKYMQEREKYRGKWYDPPLR